MIFVPLFTSLSRELAHSTLTPRTPHLPHTCSHAHLTRPRIDERGQGEEEREGTDVKSPHAPLNSPLSRHHHLSSLSPSSQSTKRSEMATLQADAPAGKDGFVANTSLTVREERGDTFLTRRGDVGVPARGSAFHLTSLTPPPCPFTTAQEEEMERVLAPEHAAQEEERLRREREAVATEAAQVRDCFF